MRGPMMANLVCKKQNRQGVYSEAPIRRNIKCRELLGSAYRKYDEGTLGSPMGPLDLEAYTLGATIVSRCLA